MPPTPPPPRQRHRHQLARVQEALTDTRVVLIAGARQAGKSTLARMALKGRTDTEIRSLDEEPLRRAAANDPADFVRHDGLLVIDEVQRVPELLLAIKAVVDADPRPARFLLTGSANVLELPRIADALPGRMETIDLWPFSQGELAAGRLERFIDRAFDGWQGVRVKTTADRRNYLDRAVVGGFPDVTSRPDPRRRAAWFDNYTRTFVGRDLRQIAGIQRTEDALRLLRAVAARSAQLLNVENLARDVGLPPNTTRRYLGYMETAYLLSVVPAWSNSRTTRAVHLPKIYLTDTGVLCHLMQADPASLSRPESDAGPVLETFVEGELRKQQSWSIDRPTIHHYRTRDGVEVDFVLEAPDGRVVGIEVKASATVRETHFSGLHHLAARTGDRFCCGIVLYTGLHTLSFGNRMTAVPMSALWEA